MIVNRKIKKLILDASAFFKHVPVWELGEECYCVSKVIREIRDKQTRQYIDALPIQIQFREPSPASVKFINDFTKKTGDFATLSLADIKILALTYELEVEYKGGASHLRTEPLKQRIEQIASAKPPPRTDSEKNSDVIEGFYESSEKVVGLENGNDKDVSYISDDFGNLKMDSKNSGMTNDVKSSSIDQRTTHHSQNETSQDESENVSTVESGDKEFENEDGGYEDTDGSQDDEDLSSENESDDDEGWITPSNINLIKKLGLDETPLSDSVEVACMTGDFAMQNALKHIGLHVIGVDGKMIHSVRTFIFRCYACFKTTTRMEKIFCPGCGNKTLKRVSVTLNPDGTQRIWISTKKPINLRGTRFSIPRPQGGKHARNPILVADQRLPEQRVSKLSRLRNDPMHEDYDARLGISPFLTRDVYSRSAQLGIRTGKKTHRGTYSWEQRNPNVTLKRGTRKKKR